MPQRQGSQASRSKDDREDRYEIFLGAKKDKRFGSVIVLGIGGLGVQIFKRVFYRLASAQSGVGSEDSMEETEVYKMIQGYGRKPPADLRQLEQIIVSFQTSSWTSLKLPRWTLIPRHIEWQSRCFIARIIIDKDSLDYLSLYLISYHPYPTDVMPWMLPDGTEVLLGP